MDELTTRWPWAQSPRPPGAQGQIMIAPETPPRPHHHLIRDSCTSWPHPETPSTNTWHLKMPGFAKNLILLKTFGELETGGTWSTCLFGGPAVNLSLLQTTTFWFLRPHYGWGAGTCSNSWSNETRETYASIFSWHTAIHTFMHVAFTAIACIFDFRWNTTQINTENIF